MVGEVPERGGDICSAVRVVAMLVYHRQCGSRVAEMVRR